MKTIVEINGINYGSTGKMAISVAEEARKQGYDVYSFFRNSREGKKRLKDNQFLIGTWLDKIISERLAFITGLNGYFNIVNTFIFLKELDTIKPDLIHLHALCDNYLNINMLFRYIEKHSIPVVWTFHDSWAFTGRCAQFKCEKWESGCGHCPYLDIYPYSLIFDPSDRVWKKRNKLYNKLDNLTIVTPSQWLAGLTLKSFFKNKYPIITINNGINLDIFKPCAKDFRIKHNIQHKFILLGVSYGWSIPKGLDTFIRLSKELPKHFQIVLVGGNSETDKIIPDNIISIHRTHNQEELAEIYSSADLFVNPTVDDNFPTVNIEALACGLPVLTYATGGSAEIIDESCGNYVETGDYDSLKKEIIRIGKDRPYTKKACLKRAESFNMEDKFNEYVDLYSKILSKQ